MINPKEAFKFVFLSSAAVLVMLSGCVGYVDGPRPDAGYTVDPTVVVQDDYVYYPGYQVYYSSSRRQYVYLDGRSWVTRSAPPRVSAEVLSASPSVRLDFHDSPAMHHASVVRQYPKQWTPADSNRGRGNDDKHEGNKGRD